MRSMLRIAGIAGSFAILAAGVFGQIATRGVSYVDNFSLPTISSFKVEANDSLPDLSLEDEIAERIMSAIDEELQVSGLHPGVTREPADIVVRFGIVKGSANAPHSLALEARVAGTNKLIWRGVATAVTLSSASNPYKWREKVTEAARMLVRRFNEEVLAPGGAP